MNGRKSSSNICWALVAEGDGMKDAFARKVGISATSVRLLTATEFISWKPALKVESAHFGITQA